MARCTFREIGGDCGAKTQMMDRFCADHQAVQCSVCGGQAVSECRAPGAEDHACGFPLCLAPACLTEHRKKWHVK
jgi:hypothetical protein